MTEFYRLEEFEYTKIIGITSYHSIRDFTFQHFLVQKEEWIPKVKEIIGSMLYKQAENKIVHEIFKYSIMQKAEEFLGRDVYLYHNTTQTLDEVALGQYRGHEGIHIYYAALMIESPHELHTTYMHETTHHAMHHLFDNKYSAPYGTDQEKQAYTSAKNQVVTNILNANDDNLKKYFVDINTDKYYDALNDSEFIARYIEYSLYADEHFYNIFQPMTDYTNEYILPKIEEHKIHHAKHCMLACIIDFRDEYSEFADYYAVVDSLFDL